MVSIVLVLLGVGATLRNQYGIQGQNYVALFTRSEISAGFHYRNLILGACFRLMICGVMVSKPVFQSSCSTSIPEKAEYEFILKFSYCEPLVKNECDERQSLILLFL